VRKLKHGDVVLVMFPRSVPSGREYFVNSRKRAAETRFDRFVGSGAGGRRSASCQIFGEFAI
jgi:hypothetical protein